jgi:hypothetical protein
MVRSPCKRHQQHLEFCTILLRTRRSGIRVSPERDVSLSNQALIAIPKTCSDLIFSPFGPTTTSHPLCLAGIKYANATMVASAAKAGPSVVSSIQEIPLVKIRESKTNPRRFFDEAKLAELAAFVR